MPLNEIDIHVPLTASQSQIIRAVEEIAARQDLEITLRAELKSFPGSTHWHFKRGRQSGTLEITCWPKGRKLWIKVQAGRTAAWIDEMSPRLKREIERRLRRAKPRKAWTEKELLKGVTPAMCGPDVIRDRKGREPI